MTKSSAAAGRWSVLGVRIRDQGHLASVEVPLVPGVNVLAGVNGVGKTSLMRAVAQALAGDTPSKGSWQLLLRRSLDPLQLDARSVTERPSNPAVLALDDYLDRALVPQHNPTSKQRPPDAYEVATRILENEIGAEPFAFTDNDSTLRVGVDRDELIAAIAGDRLWAVVGRPTGLAS